MISATGNLRTTTPYPIKDTAIILSPSYMCISFLIVCINKRNNELYLWSSRNQDWGSCHNTQRAFWSNKQLLNIIPWKQNKRKNIIIASDFTTLNSTKACSFRRCHYSIIQIYNGFLKKTESSTNLCCPSVVKWDSQELYHWQEP